MHKEHRGFLLGLLAALMIAATGALVRAADAVPFQTITFIRFALALCSILPAIWMRRVSFSLANLGKHIGRALFGLLSLYCYFYSLNYMPLVNALTFFNTAPLFIPLVILIWLKVAVPKSRFFAAFLGFIGIIIILRPFGGMIGWPNIVALAGGLFTAIVQVGVRELSKVESTETILFYYFILSTIISFFPMLYYWKPIESPMLWFLLFLIGIFSLAYQYLLTRSLTHAPSSKVSIMNYLSVVFSGLLGWWFFHEVPSLWIVVGVLFIVGGGIVVLLSKGKSHKLGQ